MTITDTTTQAPSMRHLARHFNNLPDEQLLPEVIRPYLNELLDRRVQLGEAEAQLAELRELRPIAEAEDAQATRDAAVAGKPLPKVTKVDKIEAKIADLEPRIVPLAHALHEADAALWRAAFDHPEEVRQYADERTEAARQVYSEALARADGARERYLFSLGLTKWAAAVTDRTYRGTLAFTRPGGLMDGDQALASLQRESGGER